MTHPVPAAALLNAAGEANARLSQGEHRITYISWAESCSRSDHTARELGGRSHMVYLRRFGSRPSTILLKYVGQWITTARILQQERPDTVFVMTPPVFAALPAFCYAWRYRKQVVLDAHTAAFLHPRWRWWQWLQRVLCRKAVTTLVHTEHIAQLVRDGGGDATLVPDVPVVFPEREPFARPVGFVVAVVCSFNDDEPLPAIFEAARMLPDVRFFLTGDPRHFPPHLVAQVPPNVALTGFLSTRAYGGLLAGADVILTLTTRDHTMSRGGYEGIYQGTPVIVSDWPILREAFPEGAIHVDNTPSGIVRGLEGMQESLERYRSGAARLRDLKVRRWSGIRRAVLARIEAADVRQEDVVHGR